MDRPPSPRRGAPLPVMALAVAVLAVILAGGVLVLRPHGPGADGSQAADPVARQSATTSSGLPVSRTSAGARPAAGQSATRRSPDPVTSRTPRPAPRPDPFGTDGGALAAARPGQVLAAVYDVATGQEWSLGHGQPQAEASVVKVDILQALMARNRATNTAPDQTLPEADLPVALRMMEYSDNTAATDLWFAAGGPDKIAAYNAAAGLHGTSLSRCVDCPGFPWPGWGLSTTTPEDQVALLRQLVSPGAALTASQRDYELSLMENVTPSQAWGVSGGVPPGVTVALKNGWLPLDAAADDWQVNSIGWISGDGRDYLLAVLTTGDATEQAGIDLISELAAIVWRGMK